MMEKAMLRTILLAGAATILGATAAMADASSFQPYMFNTNDQQPASVVSQGQAPPAPAQVTRPVADATGPADQRVAERTTRRHMSSREMRQHMAVGAETGGVISGAAVGVQAAGTAPEPVGQTWNPPSQSMYEPTSSPQAWSYAPGPAYASAGFFGPSYGPGYYGPGYYPAYGYGAPGVVEGRAAYEGPFAAPAGTAPLTPAWKYGYQTMADPPSESMYYTGGY
jgi:hypothetical protein